MKYPDFLFFFSKSGYFLSFALKFLIETILYYSALPFNFSVYLCDG